MTTKPDPLPPTPRCARCDQPISPCHSGPPAPAAPVEGPAVPKEFACRLAELTHWHYHGGYGETCAPCGLSFPGTGRWTSIRTDVTCPGCQRSMVERGDLAVRTDWYESMKDGDPHPTIPGFVRDRGQPSGWRPAPAASPVREPPPEPEVKPAVFRPSCTFRCDVQTCDDFCTHRQHGTELFHRCAIHLAADRAAAPAAPVREPGELTLAEAVLAKINGKIVEFHKGEHGIDWHVWSDWDMPTEPEELLRIASNRYRLKPVASSAPKPGRLVDKLMAALHTTENGSMTFTGEAQVMLEQGILEALETVKEQGTSDLLLAVERAKAALLGEREVKRGG